MRLTDGCERPSVPTTSDRVARPCSRTKSRTRNWLKSNIAPSPDERWFLFIMNGLAVTGKGRTALYGECGELAPRLAFCVSVPNSDSSRSSPTCRDRVRLAQRRAHGLVGSPRGLSPNLDENVMHASRTTKRAGAKRMLPGVRIRDAVAGTPDTSMNVRPSTGQRGSIRKRRGGVGERSGNSEG